MKKEQNRNTKEKKRVVKHASDLKDGEILLFNYVVYEPDEAEIVLYFNTTIIDRFKIHELLDIAIPDTYEFNEPE